MKIKTWHKDMSDKETVDLAYWERNMLALYYAKGWYNDDIPKNQDFLEPRFKGCRRVLTLEHGLITFHIPDDFDVGNLPKVKQNWDGHSNEEKWRRIFLYRGLEEK